MSNDHDKIAARAYQLFHERFGGQAPLDDWLKAEWEIKNSTTEKPEEETKEKSDHSGQKVKSHSPSGI
jgi:hypothetical protein